MSFIYSHQSNMLLILTSICIFIFIFLLITNFLSKEKKTALIYFIVSIILLLISDRYSFQFRNINTKEALFLAKLFKYLVFFNVLNVSLGFNRYLICLYKENHPNKEITKTFKVIEVILIIGHILLILSQLFNIYYYFDEFGIYHRTKYYALCYSFPVIATIIQYLTIIKDFKKSNKKIMIPIYMYFTLPIIAAFIQLFYQGTSLVNLMIGGSGIVLYICTISDANKLLEEKKKTEADLKLAHDIQQNEMPINSFKNDIVELYASMTPAKEVGGDFYDYILFDDNHIGLVIADVSGKGVPASLNMVKTKLLVEEKGSFIKDPAEVLKLVNKSFINNNKLDMFVTMWFGILELSTGKLTYTNAGHEDIIIYNKENGFNELKSKHGLPIGALEESIYVNNEVVINNGDMLFLYTDGVIDSFDIKNRKYDINNLLRVLNTNKDKDVKDIIKSVKLDLDNFSLGTKQFDDITMLCLKYNKEISSNINKRKFKANLKEIQNVYKYFDSVLSNVISKKALKSFYVVIDEIFSNIVKYGFTDNNGDITISIDIDKKKKNIKVSFIDNGIKFNPLEKEDPNTLLSANERNEGGLGIFIVKKLMDNVYYEYKNNKNYLTIEKKY